MIRNLSLIFALFFSLGFLQAQDPIYSQFYAAPLQLNPAFAGTTFAPRITINYRDEWAAFEGGYQTYSVAYEQSVERFNSGLGIMITGDDAGNGIYQTNQLSLVYGYRVRINQEFAIRFGIEAGMIQRRLDWNQLVFLDQIDPIEGPTAPGGGLNSTEELPPENLRKNFFDVGAGILVHGPRAYGGLSLKHLNTPDESLLLINQNLGTGLPLRLTIHGGLQIPLLSGNNRRSEAFVSPNLLFINQGGFNQINGGAYVGLGKFFGGAWYRHTIENSDAAIALIGVHFGVFRFGYSFDFTLNGLTLQRTGGTHEISLTVNFDDSREAKRRRRTARYNDCFKMFN